MTSTYRKIVEGHAQHIHGKGETVFKVNKSTAREMLFNGQVPPSARPQGVLKLSLRLLGILFLLLISLSCRDGRPSWWDDGQDTGKINTAGWEDSPFMSHDGRFLYFMYTPYNFFPIFSGGQPVKVGPERKGHNSAVCGNIYMDADTYVSERQEDGTWGIPRNLGFNGVFTDSCGVMNRSGTRFYYLSRTSGGPENPTIHVAEMNDDGTWSKPVDVGVSLKEPQDGHPCTNPHISADERTIWFSSKRPGGHGGLDLWASCRLDDGTWAEPQNLGPEINTPEDEDQIWLSKDSKKMFFNRGMVIYQSALIDGRWQTPAKVNIKDTPMAAEVSLDDAMQTMCLAVPDFKRKDITICISTMQDDGTWSKPVPLD